MCNVILFLPQSVQRSTKTKNIEGKKLAGKKGRVSCFFVLPNLIKLISVDLLRFVNKQPNSFAVLCCVNMQSGESPTFTVKNKQANRSIKFFVDHQIMRERMLQLYKTYTSFIIGSWIKRSFLSELFQVTINSTFDHLFVTKEGIKFSKSPSLSSRTRIKTAMSRSLQRKIIIKIERCIHAKRERERKEERDISLLNFKWPD